MKKVKKKRRDHLLFYPLLMLLAALILAGCAASYEGQESTKIQSASPENSASSTGSASSAEETPGTSPSPQTEEMSPHPDFPYDILGVMREKTRLVPFEPPGEVIDYDSFMAKPEAGEIKLLYVKRERETDQLIPTEYMRFSYKAEASEGHMPCSLSVILDSSSSGPADYPGGEITRPEAFSWLYHHSALLAYRLLEEGEPKEPGRRPVCWIKLENAESRELFAVTESGYVVHAQECGEELPLWEDGGFDRISQEPLTEEAFLHIAALALEVMESETEAELPREYSKPSLLPEEYWEAELELKGRIRRLAGQEVLALQDLYVNGILGNGGDWGTRHLGQQAQEDAIRMRLVTGLKETESPRFQHELLIFPDGSLKLWRDRLAVSASGMGDGFSVRALQEIELERRVDAACYEKLKAIIEEEAEAAGPEKIVPIRLARVSEAAGNARPEWSLPRKDGERSYYTENTIISDFLYDTDQGLLLLDAGEKRILRGIREAEGGRWQEPLPLDFCEAPCLLARHEQFFFILDREVVWAAEELTSKETAWTAVPLPKDTEGSSFVDMLPVLGRNGIELVLISPEKGNFSLPLSDLGKGQPFAPSQLGYRVEKTENLLRLRQGAVSWELPPYKQELRVLHISSQSLAISLLDEDEGSVSLRLYQDMREAPAAEISGESSRIDLSDFLLRPGRLYREGCLIAPREEFLDVYLLHPGHINIVKAETDPLFAVFREAAGEAPRADLETMAELRSFFQDQGLLPGQFLYCEFEDPREVDWKVVLADGISGMEGETEMLGFDMEEEERQAVCKELGIGTENAWNLLKYRKADVEKVSVYYLGMSLEELGAPMPGQYVKAYDAWYFVSPGFMPRHRNVLAACRLEDESLLVLWEDGYGESAGLVRLRRVSDQWHFISNTLIPAVP